MCYQDLRDYIDQLEARGKLKRITVPVDAHLDISPGEVRAAPCLEAELTGDSVDLARLPIRQRWPGDAILDYCDHQKAHSGLPFPVAVVLDCDPATILGTVTPEPDTLSEYQFAGLWRGGKAEQVKCKGLDLRVRDRCHQQPAGPDTSRIRRANRHERGGQGANRCTVGTAWAVV